MNRDRLIAAIQEIASSPKNVRFEDLVKLLDGHIGPLFGNYNHHGNPHHAFTLGKCTFNVAKPHKGCVKKAYIDGFLEAMETVGLYTPESAK